MAISYKGVSILFCALILCGTVYVIEQPFFSVHCLEKHMCKTGCFFEQKNAVNSQHDDSEVTEVSSKLDQPFFDPFLALAVACKELRRTEQAQKELSEKQNKYKLDLERS